MPGVVRGQDLPRLRATHHGIDRHEDDFEIQPERRVGDVIPVELDADARPFVRIDVALVDLLPTGDSRRDAIALRVVGDGATEFLRTVVWFRSWTDDAHIASKDVPELRQLVKPMMPEKDAVLRYSGIVIHGDLVQLVLLEDHGAELRDAEQLAVLSRTVLEIQDGHARIDENDEGYEGAKRQQYGQGCKDDDDFEQPTHAQVGGMR